MSIRDVNLYGSFEDWFLANIDADSAHDLREHGANCGVGGLVYYSDTVPLFNAFEDEIETMAMDGYDTELWQFAKGCDARGITQLKNALVWSAAERLAHQFKSHLDAIKTEADEEQEINEGEANEI